MQNGTKLSKFALKISHPFAQYFIAKWRLEICSTFGLRGFLKTKMGPELALPSMDSVTAPWSIIFLFGNMVGIDPGEMRCRQDGTTATIDILKSKFGSKLISRNRPINWPPTSCNYIPLDYILWGNIQTLFLLISQQEKHNRVCVIYDMRLAMLKKVD